MKFNFKGLKSVESCDSDNDADEKKSKSKPKSMKKSGPINKFRAILSGK